MEALKTSMHGDGSWRFGIARAVPGSEASDDPGGPSEGVGRMRVLQPLTSGFKLVIEGRQRGDEFLSIPAIQNSAFSFLVPFHRHLRTRPLLLQLLFTAHRSQAERRNIQEHGPDLRRSISHLPRAKARSG